MLFLQFCGIFSQVLQFFARNTWKKYHITLKRVFFLRKFHQTRRIKFSQTSCCSFKSRFFAPSLETMKKNFFRELFPLKPSSAKVGWNNVNLAGNNFTKIGKFFSGNPRLFRKKKSFLIQKFSPGTFLWIHRTELLKPRQLFFSESANFSDHNPQTIIKKNTFFWNIWKILLFVSNYLRTHRFFFDGPAEEQSRTKLWTFFAQCPKRFMKVGNFVKQLVFLRKFIRTRIV